MKQLREFLHRQVEVFLNYEFGPGMQNMTPEGIRRMSWTPEHTARLVGHLAGNWEMVEEAQRLQQNDLATEAPKSLWATDKPVMETLHRRAMDKALPYAADPGEIAADNAQADAAAADFDATPEDTKPAVNPEVP